MKLIVGLGNPGEKYQHTRHNVGFMFLDYFLKKAQEAQNDLEFKLDKYSDSEICELELNRIRIMLVKPQTFMNNSGVAVKKIASSFKLHVSSDIYVVHDDLDIPISKFKIQKGVGPELHYGVRSIEEHLKTKDFTRVRIGIDNRKPENRIPGEAYTLQNFDKGESQLLEGILQEVTEALLKQISV